MKTGVVVINLGTPVAATSAAIRRYLFAFLRDPRVIDLPALWRYLLLLVVILPFRPRRIKAAYKKIYSAKGSPLMVNSVALSQALQERLGANYQVRLAMRYGAPEIKEQLAALQHCERVIVVPLYPHYAASSTATALAEVYRAAATAWNVAELQVIPAFYRQPGFIAAYAHVIREVQQKAGWDYLLFSYHGLPKRHLTKSGCHAAAEICSSASCPLAAVEHTAHCYRWQCYESTRLLAQTLQLPVDAYGVSFQSRLGRTPWIEPYTDLELARLYQRGVRKLAVVSPSFVSDCLETIEEIGIRLRDQWLAYSGTEFFRIPCLNDHPLWVEHLSAHIKQFPS